VCIVRVYTRDGRRARIINIFGLTLSVTLDYRILTAVCRMASVFISLRADTVRQYREYTRRPLISPGRISNEYALMRLDRRTERTSALHAMQSVIDVRTGPDQTLCFRCRINF